MDIEYATKGKADAALATGIIGTVGTAMNLLGGNLGGLFGNGCNNARNGCGYSNGNCGCSENVPITRYDAGLQARIAQLEQRNALLEAENFTNTKFADLNTVYNERFRVIEAQLAAQAVTNAQVAANLACTQNSLSVLTEKVDGFTKTIIPITNICPQPAVATTPTTGA